MACEEAVAQKLITEGSEILARRWKICGVEIDILARDSAGVLMVVEVKSLPNIDWLEKRLTARQWLRLKRASAVLAARGERVVLCLATVDRTMQVQFFEEF